LLDKFSQTKKQLDQPIAYLRHSRDFDAHRRNLWGFRLLEVRSWVLYR